MWIDRSKFSTQPLRFPKYAPTGHHQCNCSSNSRKKTNILLPPWPLPSVHSSSALSKRGHNIQQHTTAINKRAFSYNRLPIGSKVHVQNAITKLWDQQATVVAIRNNGESYVVQLDNGKQCICGRILLRPANTTAISSMANRASPVPALRTTHTTAQSQPTLRRSSRWFDRAYGAAKHEIFSSGFEFI